MRRASLLALFLLAAAVPALAQDPVKVDSKHYKVEFENSSVRVLRVKYGPHEKSVMHRHPNSVAIFQTDGRVKFTYPGGKSEERHEGRPSHMDASDQTSAGKPNRQRHGSNTRGDENATKASRQEAF